MKRLRALLRLMRDSLPAREFQALNRECRDVARTLASRRDSDVRRETLSRLLKQGEPCVAVAIKKLLSVPGRPALTPHPVGAKRPTIKPARDVTARLCDMLDRVEGLKVKDPLEALERGFKRALRKVHEARAIAREDNEGSAFHELRKAIQVHQRQLQLISAGDPKALQSRIKVVRGLAQALGLEHDLTELSTWLAEMEKELSPTEMKLVARVCRAEQHKLRQRALAECSVLFASKPKVYARSLVKAWLKQVKAHA